MSQNEQESAAASTPVAADATEVAGQPPAITEPTPVKTDGLARTLSGALWLTLIAAAVAAWYWVWPLVLDREARLQQLESEVSAANTELASQVAAQAAPIQSALSEIRQQVAADSAANQTAVAVLKRDVEETLRRSDARFQRLEERFSRLTATDRRSWLLQEAAFMVRLAGQRLAAARDQQSAEALLTTADDLLREAGDPLLDAARRALAADLARLRSVPVPDVVGVDARLQALQAQSDALAVVPDEVPPPVRAESHWLARAEAGWRAALGKLSDYLVIRQRTTDLASLLTPEWEVLVRQNLRMLFEQAQIAVLSGNDRLYQRALTRARQFAGLFAEADPARVAAITEEIDALSVLTIAPPLPDLLATRSALADASRQLVGREDN